MTEVAALASGGPAENRYDANLSYEERARLRREKRKQESKTQLSLDLKSKAPYRSQSPTYRNHSSLSPSPSPITLNGTLNGPISPLIESSSKSLTPVAATNSSINSTKLFNGKPQSNSQLGPTSTGSQRAQIPNSSNSSDGNRGTKSEFDRRRYHSTPPESTVGHSKSTPPQASLADSREQPVAVGAASVTSGQGPAYRHRVNSDTAAGLGRPESPHSPVVRKQASLHLTGIIGRQQERERSCTPSPRTPTLTKFSFPTPDVHVGGDSNSTTSKAAASITVIEDTLPSEKAARLMNLGDSTTKQSVAATTDSYKEAANNGGLPPQKPKAFAAGLKFIDTPEIPDDGADATPTVTTSSSSSSVPPPSMTSSVTTNTTTTPSTKAAKLPTKTQIVFRPLDEVHAEDITVISGCQFFDPSQSQADYYTPPPPLHQISSVSKSSSESGKAVEGKDKGKKAKSKDSKSSIKLKRKNSSGKMIESTPEPEEKAKDNGGGGEDGTPIAELKSSKKKEKEEKSGKKSTQKKKRSISMSAADVGTGSLPLSLPASPSKPPLPISANAKTGLKKVSASFRGDGRDHSLSPEGSGGLLMNKLGTPNPSPVHSSSRGTTPDSTTSESEEYKRRTSLRNKLKSLMGKDKSNGKAVRTSWRFSDLGGVAQHNSDEVVSLKGFRKLSEDGEPEEVPSVTPVPPVHPVHPVHHTKSYSLSSTRSASQVSLLTHADRLNLEEDTEMVPRTYSMECIYPTYNERCVDVPAIGENLNDYKSTNSGGSPAKKDPDGDSGSSEYVTASDSDSVNRLTAVVSDTQLLSVPATTSSVSLSQDNTSEKFMTPPESTGHSQTSMELSVIGIMDKAFSSTTDAGVNSSNQKSMSKASASPKARNKKSTITTTTKGPSPKSSPITSRKASSKLASPLGRKVPGTTPSPVVRKKSSSATPNSPSPAKKSSSSSLGKISPKTSPVSARSSAAGKKVTTSPLAQRKVATASPGSSPILSRKSASAKASLTTSPLSTRRVSPSKPSTVSPKSSPSLKRKITPGSPRSSFGMRPSPPKLSRAPLDSGSSPKLSPRKSSFSRFGQGRTPFKVRAINKDESPEEKMQRIREKRKLSKLSQENISASCPTTPQASRSKREPPSALTLSQPIKFGSESPHHRPSSVSPTSPRKRKVGVSMPASPMIEIPPTLPEVRTPSPSAQPQPVTAAQNDLKTETSDVVDDRPATRTSTELEFDVESLLSSVGTQLDQLGEGEQVATKQPLKLEPVENPPDIASMPAMVFTSPIHSRQSSYDIEGEHDNIPICISPLEQAAPKQKVSAPTLPVTTPAATAAGKNSKSPSTTKKSASTGTSLAPKSPSVTRKLTDPTPLASKKSKSGIKSLRTRLNIASSKGSSKDHLSPVLEKKDSPKTSPTAQKKKTSAPLPTGKSEPPQRFTSARPPRPPLMSRLPSDPTIPTNRISSEARPSTAPTSGSAATTSSSSSSTGQKRPRNIVTARPSAAGAQKPPPGPSSSSGDSMKSKSSTSISAGSNKSLPGRGGLRASGRAKRISTTAHSTPSHGPKPSLAAESSLHHTNAGRHSMKSKSAAHLLAASGGTGRKSSLAATEVEKVSARKSMRRVSSGELLPRKIKPGASATLTRERKISQASSSASGGGGSSSISSSGKSNTLTRPRSASNAGLSRTSVTRSMRLSRGTSSRRSSTTAPRAPMLTRKATPPAGLGGLLSPTRKNSTMKRTSSGGEVLAAFDHISAQAQGSMLVGSDHRRNIRPKFRQKASSSHLKILGTREGVSSELLTPTDDDSKLQLDPNTYSTYMAKKNLAPSAMAGLAAKLDFTTVKLRKTGIVDKMIAQQAGMDPGNILHSPNPSAGNEHNTVHPIMLLKVKGRRHVQTRLVEPSGSSLNSGDVFVVVAEEKLFHWVGKSANVIEKARGSDIVMRILHKKELGCCATSPAVLKEEDSSVNANTRKDNTFWEVLGGKRAVKSTENVPSDEVYEKAVNMATVVYQLEGEAEKTQFVPIHENSAKMLQVSILHPTKILLFDFVNEVYVWIGKQSAPAMRRKAVALGKKMFDAGCRPPVFNLRSSPARQSGRYRPRSSTTKSPRHSILNSSGRRSSRATKSDIKPRPDWALFARITEGGESILFREKFSDWPEPGRIIKMKGHISSGEVLPSPPSAELQPADVDKMVKPIPAFEGLRLEGDNIHRGQGNYKVSRSTFACNRVRTNCVTKWVIKEFDNVEVPDQEIGVFYSSEAYVIRWAFTITVVRELEGIVPGEGMFARDRRYQRSLQAARQNGRSPAAPADNKDSKAKKTPRSELSDSEGSDADEDDECKRILESGGRERCAYFFWQGETSTVNEKGASALMTVELDKEKGPQVRVVQGKEPPAFLNLFSGSMILIKGRSETNSLQCRERDCRVFYTKVQVKSEACLVEITPDDEELPLSSLLRSRGCLVFYHIPANKVYLWQGTKATQSLKKASYAAAKALRNRLIDVELILVNEGDESNDFWNLTGDKKLYHSLASESRAHSYTPRLFELSSSTGEFTASEILATARNNEVEAFPFQQSELYSAVQPAIFLLDANYEVYVWLGWWPEEKNKLLKEANATTGSAHARWLRDKKLALQTAQNYIKASDRIRTPRAFMVSAGSEHERFIDLFPSWEINRTVQELNCKGIIRVVPRRVDIEDELLKYERTRFSLEILKQRPLPEGVDPARLETYLGDEEFKKVFKMDKEHFSKLPAWKQTKNKKEVGLF